MLAVEEVSWPADAVLSERVGPKPLRSVGEVGEEESRSCPGWERCTAGESMGATNEREGVQRTSKAPDGREGKGLAGWAEPRMAAAAVVES